MFRKILFCLLVSVTIFSPSTFAQDAVPAENIDSPNFGFDLGAITHQGITGSTRQDWIRGGVNFFFERVIGFLAAIIGTLSILVITYGGFLMLFSGGNDELYQKGVGYVKYSLFGLLFALSAYILVNLVQLLINSIYG